MHYKQDVQLVVTHVPTGQFLTIDHIYKTIASEYSREDHTAPH